MAVEPHLFGCRGRQVLLRGALLSPPVSRRTTRTEIRWRTWWFESSSHCSPVARVAVGVLPCCHDGSPSRGPSPSSGRRELHIVGRGSPGESSLVSVTWRKAEELHGIPRPSREAIPGERGLFLTLAQLSLGRRPGH